MLTSAELKQIVLDQNPLEPDTRYIQRLQFDNILKFISNPQILIIMGIRRSGKSTLMQQIRHTQVDQDFYLNFEDERLLSFSVNDFQTLLEIFIELFGLQKNFYFDEIQNIVGWEKFVRRLNDQGNKVFITGSNANLLSKELGTHLTGRYLAIELYPYSFYEYCMAKGRSTGDMKKLTSAQKALHKKSLNEYQQEGGFPEYLANLNINYLHMLYESIIYRDIINRYKLPNERPLKELALLLASSIGKTITYNSLKKTIGLASGTTIADYCEYLENSYLFFLVHRYDASLKKQLLAPKKCYIIDTAIAQVLGFRTSPDTGRFLENIVFLELKRRNRGEIYYHQGKNECDFLIRQGIQITEAIQVTLHLQEEDIIKREYAGLLEAMQNHDLNEGLILTENETREDFVTVGEKILKIKIQPLWEWLLMA